MIFGAGRAAGRAGCSCCTSWPCGAAFRGDDPHAHPRRSEEPVTEAEANQAVVLRLMTILSGDTPIEAGAELISPDIVAHVDGWHFKGINVWANWIQYIRTRGYVSEPTLLVDQLLAGPDATVTAHGRWMATLDGRAVTSRPCVARYRMEQGRIVEIWSTRANYVLLCGPHLQYRLGFALELLRVSRWKSRAPQLDLTDSARIRPLSRPATRSAALMAQPE